MALVIIGGSKNGLNLISKLDLSISTGGRGRSFDGKCFVAREVSIENLAEPIRPNLVLLAEIVCGSG